MAGHTAKRIALREYVNSGEVTPSAFEICDVSVDQVEEGGVLCQLLWLSVDPYMRMLMKNDLKGHYTSGYQLGQPIVSGGVARVLSSKSADHPEGAVLTGRVPWQTQFALSPAALKEAHVVDSGKAGGLPLSYFLGTLGMPGLTAYSSVKKIAEPKEGETIFVSAAAGAVGQVVGQICKNVYGLKVVGSAGAGDKVKLLQDLGFDAAFNYKETPTAQALDELCSGGIDVYYENVGGETLDLVLERMNVHGRIVACGQVSQYDLPPDKRYGVKNLFHVVGKQLKMEGFIVSTLAEGMEADFLKDMASWIKEGKVKVAEHVVEGFEKAGEAFCAMMRGENIGKTVVKVSD